MSLWLGPAGKCAMAAAKADMHACCDATSAYEQGFFSVSKSAIICFVPVVWYLVLDSPLSIPFASCTPVLVVVPQECEFFFPSEKAPLFFFRGAVSLWLGPAGKCTMAAAKADMHACCDAT